MKSALGFTSFFRKPSVSILLALLVALGVRVWLLLLHAVPFNGDEAIVALMARHILQGARPIFFYGQAYMGSLDAWLTAGAFLLFGERVAAVRGVQIALYLLNLLSVGLLARRFLGTPRRAVLATWLAALPTVLVLTYTTASLGGYGETLLLGNLCLWLGYEVLFGRWQDSWKAWLALGLLAGLGFWTLALIAVYLLPLILLGLKRFSTRRARLYALAGVAFLFASSPWWLYNLAQPGAALAALTESSLAPSTPVDHLLQLGLLGLPALLGLRFPWSPVLAPLPVLFLSLLLYLGALGYLIGAFRKGKLPLAAGAGWLLALFVVSFLALFVLTHFGIDGTGRYLLPLYLPLLLVLAALVDAAWQRAPVFGLALLVLVLGLNLFETGRAALSPDGLTTQFDPISRFDNAYDAELIAFLRAQGELTGYSNYWVSYRLAFLSGEEILFAPRLPYKADLSYTPRDNRYPYYDQVAAHSKRVAYITSKHPLLDAQLRQGLERLGVGFSEKQLGDFHIFYALTRRVSPEELGLGADSRASRSVESGG